MNRCYIGLGSNLNSPRRQLIKAIQSLRTLPRSYMIGVASMYQSKAQGRKSQPDYINTVILLKTSLKPHALLSICQRIENKQGRVRRIQNGSRTLDIDILWWQGRHIQSANLEIPHPRLHLRDFTMIPLLEIAQDEFQKKFSCKSIIKKLNK